MPADGRWDLTLRLKGRNARHRPTQPSVQWVLGLSRGKERPGRKADPSPPSNAVGHERV